MNDVFAVDGGGTKTEAQLRNPGGILLASARTGPCNLYQDAPAGLASVDEAWRACCAAAGRDPILAQRRTVLSAALAGTGAGAGRARYFDYAASFAASRLSSDAYAALLGAFEGGPGVLLSVGTGTIACRLDAAGRFERRGGWGFPAGDRGGGAWLGLQAITAWLETRDGLDPAEANDAPLWGQIEALVGRDRPAILDWLRAARPADFGGLAPAVLRAAEQGSTLADSLIEAATDHLERLLRTLAAQDLPIALTGGLAASFAPHLSTRLGQPLSDRPASPLRGAWLVGIGQAAPEFVSTSSLYSSN